MLTLYSMNFENFLGGVIVSIIVMVALVLAVAIYIVKRRNSVYIICPTFVF